MYEGDERKNTIPRGSPHVDEDTRRGYRGGGQRRKAAITSREAAQLLLELLRGDALGPVDHHLVEPRIFRLELLDDLDGARRRPAEPGLLGDALPERGHAGGRAGRAPGPPLLVGIAHEAKGGEPLVALVVGGPQAPDRLLLGVGEVEPHAPAEILAELEVAPATGGGVAVGVKNLVDDALAVERHHSLDAAGGDVVQRLAAGDRLPD